MELDIKLNEVGGKRPLKSGVFSMINIPEIQGKTQPITVESFDNERKTKRFYKKRQKDVFERLYSQQKLKTTKSGTETDEQ